MNCFRLALLRLWLVALFQPFTGAHADPIAFADNFDRTEIGDQWTSHPFSFNIEHGVLIGAQQPGTNHGAVIRHETRFRDARIAFDFMLDGAKGFNFVVDDSECIEVHAGHILRLMIRPDRVILQDDRTGAMNLALRKLKEDPANAAYVDRVTAAARLDVPLAVGHGKWHHLVIEIQNDHLRANFDGQLIGDLRSPGIAHPWKNKWGFTVDAQRVFFDNVTLSGTP